MFNWKYIYRSIKHFFQYFVRGFSDADTWSLDRSLAKLILPRLKRFEQLTIAYPDTPITTNENAFVNSELAQKQQWHEELKEMIFAFETILSEDYFVMDKDKQDKIQKGLELFGKKYMYLWW